MSSAARVITQVSVTSAVGAAMLAASASAAWADNAPGVGAAAHVRYTVSGTTATITPYLSGTQHEMKALSGKQVRSVLPQSFSVTAPKSATWVSGNAAGDSGEIVCSSRGSVPLMSTSVSATPIVLRFPGPGTYPVTLSADVCTSQGTVTKTVNITIPAGVAVKDPKAGTTGMPFIPATDAQKKAAAAAGEAKAHTTGHAPAVKDPKAGTTGMPFIPATDAQKKAAAAAGEAKAVGPHVETDRQVQRSSDSTTLWGLAGGAGIAALSGGLVLARRRR